MTEEQVDEEPCRDLNPFYGRRCEKPYGHEGMHTNFVNGTLAWGLQRTPSDPVTFAP